MPDGNIQILIADWQDEREQLSHIRHRVFIEEQHVPIELEWDEFDDSATHFLVTLDADTVVACARLKTDGQIGRMAVLSEYRNRGIGKQLLQYILVEAADQGIEKVFLHAQVSAIPFYEKQGFTADGDIFYEANIPHREMLKKLY